MFKFVFDKVKYFHLVFYFFISITSNGQITFEKTYGDTGNDYGVKVIQTKDLGYLILSNVDIDLGFGSLITKTDEFGDTLWTRFIDTSLGLPYTFAQTTDSGFVICGSSINGTFVWRWDSSGDSLWFKNYLPDTIGGPALSVIEDYSDFSLMIAGYSPRFGPGNCCLPYILRLDQYGNEIWENDLTSIQSGRAYNIIQDGPNSFAISCAEVGGSPIHRLLRINSSGNLINFSCLNYPTLVCECRVLILADLGYLLYGINVNNSNAFLTKLDSCGTLEWSKEYGYLGFAIDAIESYDKGIVMTGTSPGFNDLMVYKVDSMGDSLWVNYFGGNSSEVGRSIIESRDSGLGIVGYTRSFGMGQNDVYFIKTNYNGMILFQKNLSFDSFPLVVFPNPFYENLRININKCKSEIVEIGIYDVVGKLVHRTISSDCEQVLHLSFLHEGFYLMKIRKGSSNYFQNLIKLYR